MTVADTSKIVTFRLGDDLFAADINSVERVLRWQEPTAVPNLPDWIEGVLEYQGRVVPVVNLRRRFEMPAADAAAETRILIFNAAGEWVAAVVDSVLEVAVLDATRLSPPPPLFGGVSAEYLRGIVRRGDRLVVLLDVARLLTSTERLVLDRAAQDALKDG